MKLLLKLIRKERENVISLLYERRKHCFCFVLQYLQVRGDV